MKIQREQLLWAGVVLLVGTPAILMALFWVLPPKPMLIFLWLFSLAVLVCGAFIFRMQDWILIGTGTALFILLDRYGPSWWYPVVMIALAVAYLFRGDGGLTKRPSGPCHVPASDCVGRGVDDLGARGDGPNI
jgi:hypothetical protein